MLGWTARLPWVVGLVVAGCGDGAAVVAAPPTLVSTSLDGAPFLVPTSTIGLRFSVPPDPGSLADGIAVVIGVPDEGLRKALEKPPVSDAQRDLLAPIRVDGQLDGATGSTDVNIVPLRPLLPNALHTLVVTTNLSAGGLRLGKSVEQAFTTGAAATGTASWSLSAPASGAAGVVRNLRRIEVGFSRPVYFVSASSLVMIDDHDQPVPASLTRSDDLASYTLWPTEPLPSLARLRVVVRPTVRDSDGSSPFTLDPPPGFSTGTELRAMPPAIDRVQLASSSGCVVARLSTMPPAVAALCLDGDCASDLSLAQMHELSRALPPGAQAQVTLRARDESTAPEAATAPVSSPPSSPRALVITEVLSHPRGPHYGQQFVELRNVGLVPVALGGLELHDEGGFDQLPDVTVPAGAFALVVPASFVSDDGLDAPVPPATVIARTERGQLGKNGIRQTGESLALLEPDGRAVSLFSTDGLQLAAGQSATRVGACDISGAYAPTRGGSATPGAP